MEDLSQPMTKKERKALRKLEKTQVQDSKEQRHRRNRFFLWGGIFLGIIGVVAILLRFGSSSGSESGVVLGEITSRDRTKGNSESAVVLVEYSDFQCPACAYVYPILKRLSEEFEGRVKFVYRHFPLKQHANAELAARASEAAGQQGKFWEMHDLLFEKQEVWASTSDPKKQFSAYAISLGLDSEAFLKDLGSSEVKNKVSDDAASGIRANVQGTPTFFLNGKKIPSPKNEDEFRRLLDNAAQGNP